MLIKVFRRDVESNPRLISRESILLTINNHLNLLYRVYLLIYRMTIFFFHQWSGSQQHTWASLEQCLQAGSSLLPTTRRQETTKANSQKMCCPRSQSNPIRILHQTISMLGSEHGIFGLLFLLTTLGIA